MSKQQDGNTSSHALINDHSGKALLDVPNVMIGGKSIFHKRSDLSKASEDSETIEPNVAKVKGNSILGKSNEESASLLDKLFGSPLALTGGGSSTTFGVIVISSSVSLFENNCVYVFFKLLSFLTQQ